MAGYTRNPQTVPDDSPGGSTTRQAVADQNSIAINDLYTALNAHSNNEEGRSHADIDTTLDIQQTLRDETLIFRNEAETFSFNSADSASASEVSNQASLVNKDASASSASEAQESAISISGYLQSKIGEIIERLPTYINNSLGFIKVGRLEHQRSTYPPLWQHIEEHPEIVKTDAEWLAIEALSPTSSVPYYSSGDGSTTFRTPSNGTGAFARSVNLTGGASLGTIDEGHNSQIEDHKHATADFSGTPSSGNITFSDSSSALPFGKIELNTTSAVLGTARQTPLSDGGVAVGANWLVALTSPETYGNTGETAPQAYYRSYWIYTGNPLTYREVVEPDVVQQVAVSTQKMLDLEAEYASTDKSYTNIVDPLATGANPSARQYSDGTIVGYTDTLGDYVRLPCGVDLTGFIIRS